MKEHLNPENFYELLNGDFNKRELLMEHIINCKKCKKSFELRRSLIESIRNIERLSLPSNFSSNVMLEIEKRNVFFRRLSLILTLLTLSISAFLFLFFYISGSPGMYLSEISNRYTAQALKIFKFTVKFAMGVNKIIRSLFDILGKISSLYSNLSIISLIFVISILAISIAIIFVILINHYSPWKEV
ncbi:MAG: hypothetical protein ACUVUG_04810 [Candidatus Aminicenantia bacterium]